MADIEQQFKATINSYKDYERIVIGLSGGVDSVVLLHLIKRFWNGPIVAIHVNHGLSSNASQWQSHCEELCQNMDVPLICEQVVVEHDGKGLESAARDQRYAAFHKHLQADDILCLAQHANDQLETMLYRLVRGAGLAGMSAMKPWEKRQLHTADAQEYFILRPLLAFGKPAVVQYAEQCGLSWVEDESNDDTRFDRNFLRHDVVPQLIHRWPHAAASAQRAAEHLQQEKALLDEMLSDKLKVCSQQGSCWDCFPRLLVEPLLDSSLAMQKALLRQWLAMAHVSPSTMQLEQILMMFDAQADAQPQLQLGMLSVCRYGDALYLLKAMPEQVALDSEAEGHYRIYLYEGDEPFEFELVGSKSVQIKVGLNANDKVALTGSDHRQQMKKLWQQWAVPTWLRHRIPHVFDGDRLVQIVGFTPNDSRYCEMLIRR